jgi:hypothetical protein
VQSALTVREVPATRAPPLRRKVECRTMHAIGLWTNPGQELAYGGVSDSSAATATPDLRRPPGRGAVARQCAMRLHVVEADRCTSHLTLSPLPLYECCELLEPAFSDS